MPRPTDKTRAVVQEIRDGVWHVEHQMKTLEGPSWTAEGLDRAAGRYPLSVERHVMRMAELLVPGVTTVTPHARYYALHGLIAVEAAREGLDESQVQELLRRAEVVVAAVSHVHEHGDDIGLATAHGTDAILPMLRSPTVDMAQASKSEKPGYVRNPWGFWNPYAASEVALRIQSRTSAPEPGDACDEVAVRDGLRRLLTLAREPVLRTGDLHEYGHLCVCGGADSADGRWLARLFCGDSQLSGHAKSPDATRRQTIRLMTRIIETHEVRSASWDITPVLAYGDFVTTDGVVADLAATPIWRGVVLRNYAVGAWRRLWAWMVDQVHEADGLMRVEELAQLLAAQMPEDSVAAFLDSLPPTTTPAGSLAPAELTLRSRQDKPVPVRELAVLAAGARRVDELAGAVKDAFLGHRGVELGPEWMARRLDAARPTALKDFAYTLAADLVTRSQRVALSKAIRNSDGTLWLPTRLQERGGFLFSRGREGSGDVGLRIDQLTMVLAGAGVVRRADGVWQVTAMGQALLA